MKLSFLQDLFSRKQRETNNDVAALYLRYQPQIYRYLYYRTGDAQTAEDLTAEVFLKVVQVLANRNTPPVHIQAWLYQVARNLAIDQYRRSAAHPILELAEDLAQPDADLNQRLDFNLTSALLAQALNRLEESQREVLVLRFIEALPIAQTAWVVHKSEDAVKALQRRGLLALRRLLEKEELEHERSK